MSILKSAVAVFALVVATQAQASRYAWCEVDGHKTGKSYLTGLIEIEESQDAYLALRDGEWPQQFRAYVEATLDDYTQFQGCTYENSFDKAREMIEGQVVKYEDGVETGWVGDRLAAVDGGEKSTRPTEGVQVVAPGTKLHAEPTPGNSRAASLNRAKDDAAFARKQAEYEAALADNKRLQEEFVRQQAENQAKAAVSAAKAAAAKAEWEARVAACKAGDIKQCGTPASAQ